jgi:hypothetical protein
MCGKHSFSLTLTYHLCMCINTLRSASAIPWENSLVITGPAVFPFMFVLTQVRKVIVTSQSMVWHHGHRRQMMQKYVSNWSNWNAVISVWQTAHVLLFRLVVRGNLTPQLVATIAQMLFVADVRLAAIKRNCENFVFLPKWKKHVGECN